MSALGAIPSNDMSNMGYCRFEHTLADLEDCEEHIEDALGGIEYESRARMIELCERIVDTFKDWEFKDHTDCDCGKCD